MGLSTTSLDKTWWMLTCPAILETQNLHHAFLLCLYFVMAFSLFYLLTWAFSTGGGVAWRDNRNFLGRVRIPGPRGLPVFGSLFSLSHGLAHRTLSHLAESLKAKQLMAFSLGSTPAVVTSDPNIAREILVSPYFADRPIKQSAKLLMFSRAIGFAPNGSYWRLLRRISSTHLFSPRRISAHEAGRQLDSAAMLRDVLNEQSRKGAVVLRKHLQNAALNNITATVFGRRYDLSSENEETRELTELVREGFELLGAFNFSDHLPWLNYLYDPFRVQERCCNLVPRVKKFVKRIIDEHRNCRSNDENDILVGSDFVDILLSLDGDEKLAEDDMVAVLWEMIFRGTDTTALVTEWVLAELVLNPNVQAKLQQELDLVVDLGPGPRSHITDADVAKSPYLQAVVKETLRLHPPGPLLSWARLSTSDVHLSNGMVVPANTTAMVNMWAITHDPHVWEDPHVFRPERFLDTADVDVRGSDLRLAPFGAGRRVCPGKNLGLVTVGLWVAKLVHSFKWLEDVTNPVDLGEVLKLSCEMKEPLHAIALPRYATDQLF